MQATFKVNVKMYYNKSGEMEVLDTSVEENIEGKQTKTALFKFISRTTVLSINFSISISESQIDFNC